MRDERRHNALLVESLVSVVRDGQQGLGTAPTLIKQLLKPGVGGQEPWQGFVTKLDDEVAYGPADWHRFVQTPPLKGLGSSHELLVQLVSKDVEAKSLLDQVAQRSRGGDTRSENARTNLDNIQIGFPSGTSSAAALRRLRKDRPDLHEQVLAGDLSPHRAMVNAGFRKRTATVPVDDPLAAARTIRRQFGRDALIALIAALLEPQEGPA